MPNRDLLLSIVLPLKNEADNIETLVNEIESALLAVQGRFEIIAVNDGSTDGTAEKLQTLSNRVTAYHHLQSCGQSAALRTGILNARAGIIVTMDGDGQNDPADLPALWQIYQDYTSSQRVMVMGERIKRCDSWSKKIASRLGNGIRQFFLKDGVRDTGCSLKIFSRDDFLLLPYFDHMHRFMPALMKRENIRTITKPVNHRPRQHGTSNYGFWDRLLVSLSDILGVVWLMRRRRLPELVK